MPKAAEALRLGPVAGGRRWLRTRNAISKRDRYSPSPVPHDGLLPFWRTEIVLVRRHDQCRDWNTTPTANSRVLDAVRPGGSWHGVRLTREQASLTMVFHAIRLL